MSKSALKHKTGSMTIVKELVTSVTSETAFEAMGIKFPHDLNLESAVLGACMLEKGAFQLVKRVLQKKEAFYKEPNQTVYEAMDRLNKRADPIDLLTVTDEIRKMGLFFSKERKEQLKGKRLENYSLFAVPHVAYLVELTGTVGPSANTEYHSRIIYQRFMRRKTIVESFFGNDTVHLEVYFEPLKTVPTKPGYALSMKYIEALLVEEKNWNGPFQMPICQIGTYYIITHKDGCYINQYYDLLPTPHGNCMGAEMWGNCQLKPKKREKKTTRM